MTYEVQIRNRKGPKGTGPWTDYRDFRTFTDREVAEKVSEQLNRFGGSTRVVTK